jgi:hypothetical protein
MKERAYGIHEPYYRLIDPSAAKKENSIIAGFNPLEEFARFGIPCAPASNDMTRIDKVKQYLKSRDTSIWPQVRIFEDLIDLRHDMQFVQYDEFRMRNYDDVDPKSGKIKDKYKCLPDCVSYVLNNEGAMLETDKEDKGHEDYKPHGTKLRGNASLGAY